MKHMDIVKAIIKQKIAKTRRENLCIEAFSYEKKTLLRYYPNKNSWPRPTSQADPRISNGPHLRDVNRYTSQNC